MSMYNLTSALPTTPAALTPSALKPRATTPTPTSGASSTSANSTQDIGSTFLNLLVSELQNQDPTAPMDSTAMVGQMISLNQLDQLTSINQTLTNTIGSGSTATSTSTSGSSKPTGSISTPAASAAVAQALQILNGSTMASNPALNPASLGSLSSLASFLPQ